MIIVTPSPPAFQKRSGNFDVLSSSTAMDLDSEKRAAEAQMYRKTAIEAAGGGSNGLWVECSMQKNT